MPPSELPIWASDIHFCAFLVLLLISLRKIFAYLPILWSWLFWIYSTFIQLYFEYTILSIPMLSLRHSPKIEISRWAVTHSKFHIVRHSGLRFRLLKHCTYTSHRPESQPWCRPSKIWTKNAQKFISLLCLSSHFITLSKWYTLFPFLLFSINIKHLQYQ